MKEIVWILVLYGIVQIIVESSLFKPVRNFFGNYFWTQPIHILITCVICTSTWIAFILSNIWYSPVYNIFSYPVTIFGRDVTFFFDGMLGSCIVWFIHMFEQFLSVSIKKISSEILN